MFFSLSKFTSISTTFTLLFTSPNMNYFSSDTYIGYGTYAGSPSEILTLFDISSTSDDDVSVVALAPLTIELPLGIRNISTYLRDYHFFPTMIHLHEP